MVPVKSDKFSILASVMLHAAVLTALALGIGSGQGGHDTLERQYIVVEFAQATGGGTPPPVAPPPKAQKVNAPLKVKAAKPPAMKKVRHPEVPEVKEETTSVEAEKTPSPVAYENAEPEVKASSDELPVVESVEALSSASPEVVYTEGEDAAGSDPTYLSSADAMEADAFFAPNGAGAEGAGLGAQFREIRINGIRSAIQDSVVYPPLARRRGLEGYVLASFIVGPDGLPHDVQVIESSGYRMFDREVMRVIQAASPYPVVDIAVEVPVTFRLSNR